MAVDRSMAAPVTEFGMESMGSTIAMPTVIFVPEPVSRAIVMPLEVFMLEAWPGANEISPGKMVTATPAEAAPVVMVTHRIICVHKANATVHRAVTAIFACSP